MSLTYEKCNDIPSKGGMSAQEVKVVAQKLGINIQGKKKAELCKEIVERHEKSPVEENSALAKPKIIIKPIKETNAKKEVDLKKEAEKQEVVIQRVLKEIDHLVTTSKKQLECCLEHYNSEIQRLSKKFRKAHKKELEIITDKFLIPFVKMYSEFYFTYAYLEKTSKNRLNSIDYITENIVKLVDEYVRLLHSALSELDEEFLFLVFPPTEEYEAVEEKSEICKSSPELGKSYLNCIRTYMMQIISRFVLLSKELFKQVSKTYKEGDEIYKTSKKLVEFTRISIKVLDQMNLYIESILQCRDDYCNLDFCTKKSGKLYGSYCLPKYPGYLEKDWVRKTYLSHL